MKVSLLHLWLLPVLAASFQSSTPSFTVFKHITSLKSTTSEATTSTNNSNKLLSRDRYIATNRFTVRRGKEAKFEKRWATRKSRLSTLDGFRYFHLMRRVSVDGALDSGVDPELANVDGKKFGNYVSFTIWNEKKNFNAWRSGDAFREAHGGTSIKAFLGTMVKSAMLLKGAPRPAFYDGLLQRSIIPETIPETVDGWRNIESDTLGKQILPSECFIACNQFFVPSENAKDFELRWAGRESKLSECDGFISFGLLRRDAKAKGHGVSPLGDDEPTYVSTAVWKDRVSFQKWKEGKSLKKRHETSSYDTTGNNTSTEKKQSSKPLWTQPPVPIFYEGTLVITNEEGA